MMNAGWKALRLCMVFMTLPVLASCLEFYSDKPVINASNAEKSHLFDGYLFSVTEGESGTKLKLARLIVPAEDRPKSFKTYAFTTSGEDLSEIKAFSHQYARKLYGSFYLLSEINADYTGGFENEIVALNADVIHIIESNVQDPEGKNGKKEHAGVVFVNELIRRNHSLTRIPKHTRGVNLSSNPSNDLKSISNVLKSSLASGSLYVSKKPVLISLSGMKKRYPEFYSRVDIAGLKELAFYCVPWSEKNAEWCRAKFEALGSALNKRHLAETDREPTEAEMNQALRRTFAGQLFNARITKLGSCRKAARNDYYCRYRYISVNWGNFWKENGVWNFQIAN